MNNNPHHISPQEKEAIQLWKNYQTIKEQIFWKKYNRLLKKTADLPKITKPVTNALPTPVIKTPVTNKPLPVKQDIIHSSVGALIGRIFNMILVLTLICGAISHFYKESSFTFYAFVVLGLLTSVLSFIGLHFIYVKVTSNGLTISGHLLSPRHYYSNKDIHQIEIINFDGSKPGSSIKVYFKGGGHRKYHGNLSTKKHQLLNIVLNKAKIKYSYEHKTY